MQDPQRRRLNTLTKHLTAPGAGQGPTDASRERVDDEEAPDLRLHQDGWGYSDTEFELTEKGDITLVGDKYPFSGFIFPDFRPWIEKTLGIDASDGSARVPPVLNGPEPIRNERFVQGIASAGVGEGGGKVSFEPQDRIFHGHGHTCQEIYKVRFGQFQRVPDCVIWPKSHEEVEVIVRLANEHDVVIIPFGGGTSVSGALECPANERRMIVSLDMHLMNKIKWVDRENMLVCMEAGIIGQDVKRRLEALGLTIGHEPDSLEFSSLGGWIATRASGMKRSVYGNIEDMLVRVKMVTGVGTIDRACDVPRLSIGPDVQQMVLGSEGALGVVTEAVLRMRELPQVTQYGSFIFPTFEMGVSFMHEVSRRRCTPASIRLVDNEQFQLGHSLKPEKKNPFAPIVDGFKKFYITKWHGFQPTDICVATMLFEGNKEEVAAHARRIAAIAQQFRGVDAGEENGYRGYFLTFMIAYLRDFGVRFSYMAESFETSVPWSNVLLLCEAVKRRVHASCKEAGIQTAPFVSCRVTQTYDTGACVYFYFGFSWKGIKDPVGTFTFIEDAARDEILALGGSLSHHHGVGKHRRKWLRGQVSDAGFEALRSVKAALDPRNVFGNGNLVGEGGH